MTNKKQIQTKKISFILALSVIIYAAIDTYLFLCHDINIMRITTPVILGLVIAIILCGLLHKFFYKWLTKNPINFSFGEPSTPIVKSENIIESMDATETQPIKQPMDLPEQESSPSQQSNQDTVNSDCPQDSHLNKYDSILVELKKKEIERQVSTHKHGDKPTFNYDVPLRNRLYTFIRLPFGMRNNIMILFQSKKRVFLIRTFILPRKLIYGTFFLISHIVMV